ncbi:sulfurtransferase [Trichlorobacter ammonificans]|uniref:Rhodanese domain protein n=1 Tax=Trichlorobacter ammonificans TaxID=2916410 RepID=A0ABM9D9S4_9BACT|nr:rhodanese-like domain-containing protein [Trichlorobacter ammonificans]CAH2031965.1 Rhodanese domain protein [Trichlorobacter ammonificans]
MHSVIRFIHRRAAAAAVPFIALLFLASAAAAADLGLIEPATLKGAANRWVVLDARPPAEWEAGHIPGAIPFSWETYTRTDTKGIKYSSFSPQELAVILAGLGIDEKTPLVIYGDADKSWGGEGYNAWLFSWLGHKGPIRILNGGIQAWRAQGFSLTKGAERPLPARARYQVDLKPQYAISTEEVQQAGGNYTLVDTRSTLEWLKGRIPGAVHIPWDDFYTGKERRPLSQAELRKLLAKHGVNPGKPVVFYCLGGVRSAYAWLVARLAGLPDARNYKGGWAAWEKRGGQ